MGAPRAGGPLGPRNLDGLIEGVADGKSRVTMQVCLEPDMISTDLRTST